MFLVRFLSLAIIFLLLAACAGQRVPGQAGPIIDTKGVDMSAYQTDLAECQSYANQVPVAERAATGAVVGGVIGGAVGAVVGDSSTAQRGAGAGAIGGTVQGTSSGLQEQEQVLRNCLRGRGYRVLN